MKFFKIVHSDGLTDELEADRVVRDGTTIYVDSRVDGCWVNDRALPVGDVLDVRKRFTDFDGGRRWASHRLTYMPDRFDVTTRARS